MKNCVIKLAALLALPLCSSGVAAETLTGRIVDGADHLRGIPAVTVIALTTDGASLTSGMTDATGRYTLNVAAQPAKLYYDKVGYLNRKASRPVATIQGEQPNIVLSRMNAEAAYYDRVADMFNSGTGDSARQYAAIVIALPDSHKERVLAKLDQRAKSQFLSAELTQKIGGQVAGGINIEASVDSPTGVVMLSGFVLSNTEKEQAGKVARNARGVNEVKNNISVK